MTSSPEHSAAEGHETNGTVEDLSAETRGVRRWIPQVLAVLLAAYGIWAFVNVLEVRELRDRLRRLHVWQGELHELHVAAERTAADGGDASVIDVPLTSLGRAIAANEAPPLSIDARWAAQALDSLAPDEPVPSAARRRVQVVRTLDESVEQSASMAIEELDRRVDALYGFLGGTLVLSLTILLQTLAAMRRGDELLTLHARLASRLRALRVAQTSLALSEERYELSSRGSNDGMWDWAIDANQVYYSDRWAELVGADADGLGGTPDDWFDRVHPEDAPTLRDAIEAYLAAPSGVFEHEHRLLRRDGEYIVALARGLAVPSRDGASLRFVGSHTDVTQARVLDRMKRQFLSTMSHELRTPLTSILGSLGLVRGGAVAGVSDASRALVDVAYDNSVRLLRLINEILDYERLQSGDAVYDRRPFDLGAVVEHVASTLGNDGASSGVSVVFDGADEPVWVDGDSERIGSVVARLVDNGARHSPPGSLVRVTVRYTGDRVEVSVEDDGPGVPPEQAARIFEAFTQVDDTDARDVEGAGLGLAACRLVIEAHEGEIGYERDGVTRFWFSLPTCAAPTESRAATS